MRRLSGFAVDSSCREAALAARLDNGLAHLPKPHQTAMYGQGRPPLSQLFTLVIIAGVMFAPGILFTERPVIAAENTAAENTAAENTAAEAMADKINSIDQAASESRGLYDQSTKPFEFRSGNPQWPLVATADSSTVTVRIRSLPEHTDRDLVLVYELVRVDDGAVVGREQTDLRLNDAGDSDAIAIASSAPTEPGVYEIRCRLSEKTDRIWSRLTGSADAIARIRTPWLVYRDTSSTDTSATNRQRSGSTWIDPVPIQRIDPSDWETPSWIPDGATRLVPNVRRVGDSLRPWREDSSAQATTLRPGESFVGMLTEIRPHGLYQLAVTLGETVTDLDEALLRVDFASSPAFQKITNSVTWRHSRQIDVSTGQLSIDRVHQILHHATAENEFIRITNESSGSTLSIHSVQLSRNLAQTSARSETIPQRGVSIWTRSTNWLADLTSDLPVINNRDGYAEPTWQLYRLWKALSRLPDHADWCGYDEISLPIDPSIYAQPNSSAQANSQDSPSADASPGTKWARNLSATAAARWSPTDRLTVTLRPFGRPPEVNATVVPHDGEHLVHDGRSAISVADSVMRENPSRLTILSDELPLSISRAFQESLHQFRKIPQQGETIASSADASSDYVRVLFQSGAGNEGGEAAVVTIINSAPWTSQVHFRFSGGKVAKCELDESGTSTAVLSVGSDQQDRLLTIAPSSIVNVKVQGVGGAIRLNAWRCRMVGGEQTLERLKTYVSEVVGGISTLALPRDYGKLRNGSFEIAGQVGVVGWMHTQFPDSAVVLDADEAVDGAHSIRMSTDTKLAGRTWLVSEPIEVPDSGRLAVSLATRASVQQSNSTKNATSAQASTTDGTNDRTAGATHRVRVSLEGNRQGRPVRIATEFEVPSDGQWQSRRIVLEAEQLRREEMDSLRLTIDSLTPGKLWIDDIHLHDQFATHAERTALQGKAFLAIQGLQRQNTKPAASLLNHNWSKYLLAQVELKRLTSGEATLRNPKQPADVRTTPEAASSSAANRGVPAKMTDAEATESEGERESVARRLRDWLPKPIRF